MRNKAFTTGASAACLLMSLSACQAPGQAESASSSGLALVAAVPPVAAATSTAPASRATTQAANQATNTTPAPPAPPEPQSQPSTPRPQLSAEEAAHFTQAAYLAQGPSPWLPPPFADPSGWKPDFIVAADGSGTHRRVQDAVDAVPSLTSSTSAASTKAAATHPRRYFILVRPGTYREPLCVQGKVPLTLYGLPADTARTVIVEGRYNALPKAPGTAAHPCYPDAAAANHGTPGTASVVFASPDFHAAFLTISNDAMNHVRAGQGYPAGVAESGGAQAVALMTLADRVLLDGVRLLGHQDTFHARRPQPDAPARVLVRRSLIAGDVDFIFGNATLVIDQSRIISRAGRRPPGHGGHVLAPSTPAASAYGLLVQRSQLLAEPGVAPGSISLGRAWDEGVPRGTWQPGTSPNGQALIRDSQLGPHLGPWAASTSRRAPVTEGPLAHRMREYNNRAISADEAAAEADRASAL